MTTNFKIEPLNKTNFDTWKLQVEAILVKNDAWGYVSGEILKPADNDGAAAWAIADKKAKSDLILSISPQELKQVKGCTTSKEVWDKLHSIYQSKGPARKATLLKKLLLSKVRHGEHMRDDINNFFDTVDKLKDMDVAINEDLLAIMLLYSLPDEYENFRCAIETRDDLPDPEALRVKILEENDSRRGKEEDGRRDDGALLIRKTTNKFIPREQVTRDFVCYRCHEKGHLARNCTNNNVRRVNNARHVAEESESAGYHVAFSTTEDYSEENMWCLDSGCTSHICRNRSEFKCWNQEDKARFVNLANRSTTSVTGVGTVGITVSSGTKVTSLDLYNTLCVPDLRTNLMSVTKITDKGYQVLFSKQTASVLDKSGNVVLVADRINDLYYVRTDKSKERSNFVSSSDELYLWHKRFGHLNFRDLKTIISSQSITGTNPRIGKQQSKSCDACIMGKMFHAPYPTKSQRKTELLEIIHSDVCGPMSTESFGGSKYFITFIDDCSRWCEVTFLKRKSDALDAFRNFKQKVECMFNRKIKYLQTDNGGEFVNQEFNKFLEDCGIQRRLAVSYCPSQNGVAERKNRLLQEIARCLLYESKLPVKFWAEAVAAANHIRNRCPSRGINGKIPFTVWMGRKPHVSYFRVFGSRVYVLEDKLKEKGKFYPRAKEGIFVGYSDTSKGYRIWMVQEKKFRISRNVKFLENDQGGVNFDDTTLPSHSDNNTGGEIEVIFSPRKCQKETMSNVNTKKRENDNMKTDDKEPRPQIRSSNRINKGIPPVRFNSQSDKNNTNVKESILSAGAEEHKTDEVYEPKGWKDMQKLSEEEKRNWQSAADEEMHSLIKNGTWELVELPKDKNVIGCKWVFKVKYGSNGKIDRYKARLVAKGYSQKFGEDYDQVFAPVTHQTSIRAIKLLEV